MNISNFLKTIILVIVVVLGIVAYFTVLPWVTIYLGISSLPNPPRPEVTYGEFPLRLEYEINGQRKVIQDTFICENDGVGMDEGQGKYRKWKGHLASGNERLILLKVDKPISRRSDKKVVRQEIYYPTGSARYYMGDMKEYETYIRFLSDAYFFEEYEDGKTSADIIYPEELLEEFNIKLISWTPSPPIKNSFR